MRRRERRVRGVGPLLVVEGLTKAFGPQAVLDGVTFSVDRGELVCLNGGNGAGKSTILRCLVGLAAAEGTVRVGGADPTRQRAARTMVGYLPQNPALLETATAREALAFIARLRGAAPGEHGLPGAFLPPLDARLGTLSAGQRQRVALASALLGEPELLLLDEPVANLDSEARSAVWGALRARSAEGTAVVVASPAPQELAGVAERLIHLENGRVAGDGPMPDLGVLTAIAREEG